MDSQEYSIDGSQVWNILMEKYHSYSASNWDRAANVNKLTKDRKTETVSEVDLCERHKNKEKVRVTQV